MRRPPPFAPLLVRGRIAREHLVEKVAQPCGQLVREGRRSVIGGDFKLYDREMEAQEKTIAELRRPRPHQYEIVRIGDSK